MYYIDVQGFLEHPERDWEESLAAMMESPPEASEAENSPHTYAREGLDNNSLFESIEQQ